MCYLLRTFFLSFLGLLTTLVGDGNILIAHQLDKPRVDIETLFTPSGWIGDGEFGRRYITFSGADRSAPHSRSTSIKITYTFGPKRFAGLYWQNIPNNWGEKPGNNYSGKGLSKITFWAKGETGNEIVEFKSGGIDSSKKEYRDSLSITTGRISLSKEWRQYHIDLSDANLSSVIGGFCWVASADYNPDGKITVYLEDIILE
jgi:hypothetical protein